MCHLTLSFLTVNPIRATSVIIFGTVMFLNTWCSMKKNTPLENLTWLLVQLMRMQFRSNKREKKIFVVVHSLAFGGRGCFFSNRRLKKKCRIFNATLGYPGEGPKKKTSPKTERQGLLKSSKKSTKVVDTKPRESSRPKKPSFESSRQHRKPTNERQYYY